MADYLIVEDSATVRLTLKRILETVDPGEVTIIEAASPHEAIEKFKQNPVDFVFLDIVFGEETANAAMREMLAQKPDAKIILITSLMRGDPRVLDALGQGAVGYLEKPLRRGAVTQILAELEQEARKTRRIR